MQRVLAAVLAAGMISGLTACQGGGSSTGQNETEAEATEAAEAGSLANGLTAEEGAEIEIAYWEGSTADKEAWDEVLANLKADHPEITIVTQTYPSSDYWDMMDTRIAGNDWPDVIRYSYQKIGKFKSADVMLDLTPYFTQENLDDVSPAFLQSGMYNGKLVAMPHHTDTIALFYNKRMFEEAGIRIPTSVEDGWSWEELMDISRTLKEKYNLPYAFGGIWGKR